MIVHLTKMTATSGLLILLVVCTGSFVAFSAEPEKNVEPVRASDSVSRLPKLFFDDKLPVKEKGINLCYPHIGCTRRIKGYHKPMHPLEMNASFYLTNKEGMVKLKYDETINCLKDEQTCDVYPYDLSIIEKFKFNPMDRTFIIVGGWNSKEPDSFVKAVKEQWLSMDESVNIIEAYWTGGSTSIYWRAVASTKIFARQLAVLIYYLGQLKGNYLLSDSSYTGQFNCVGHSLGAHICSFTGKDLDGSMGLITALDPALPLFSKVENEMMLHKSDAKLVQVLHTNGGLYGQVDPLGDLDFYANDGKSQPGCKMDTVTGCSHARACDIYIQFLQNEKYIKQFLSTLDKKYHINHRLFSYRSESFESFQDGSTFMKNCYSATFGKYGTQTGMEECIVPLDFVTDADKQLHHLKTKYHLDITAEKSKESSNKLYFYTGEKAPYLNNHHLLKVRVEKSPSLPSRCDILIDLEMSGKGTAEKIIKNYEFTDQGSQLVLTIPFLSMNMKSKYELASLDAHEFYRSDTTKLEDSLLSIFPKAVRVIGYPVGKSKSKKSWTKSLLGFLGFGEKSESDSATGCDLNIASITIQPMKKLSRLLIAYYDTSAKVNSKPDLVFLLQNNTAGSLFEDDSKKRPIDASDDFYLSKALVGTHEEDGYLDLDKEASQAGSEVGEKDENRENEVEANVEKPETSSIPRSVWIFSTAITIMLILGFVYWQLTNKPLVPDQVLLTESEA